MKKTYKSKISYGLLIFVFIVCFAPMIPSLLHDTVNREIIIMVIVVLLLYAFILHLFLTTQYTIENEILKIKSGIFSYKPVDIKQIKEVSKTNSILASPAASLDRIKIKYGKFNHTIIISPKEKLKFVEDLLAINPNISQSDLLN